MSERETKKEKEWKERSGGFNWTERASERVREHQREREREREREKESTREREH